MVRTDRTQRRRLDPGERRERILAAATDAFAVAPYDEVSVAAIAAQAEASEPLVYRYFTGKADLYAQIVMRAIADLLGRQAAALDALPGGVPVRDRVRTTTLVYLDHVAAHPRGWASPLHRPGSEPEQAATIRREARRDYVERLRELLAPATTVRHEFALWGFFGFLDAACLCWVERGCPGDERESLADTALGALEGALGDWAA
jgi:AcrR family transcriptional regulator